MHAQFVFTVLSFNVGEKYLQLKCTNVHNLEIIGSCRLRDANCGPLNREASVLPLGYHCYLLDIGTNVGYSYTLLEY